MLLLRVLWRLPHPIQSQPTQNNHEMQASIEMKMYSIGFQCDSDKSSQFATSKWRLTNNSSRNISPIRCFMPQLYSRVYNYNMIYKL